MEPNHLLAIGLGNVHKKIDILKSGINSNIESSFNILSESLKSLSSSVDTDFQSVNNIIGNHDKLIIKDINNNNPMDIISALNHLENNKVNINLETEIGSYGIHILDFIDKDTTTHSHKVYTTDYIDEAMDSLYTDLNKCYVNIMNCDCYSSPTSIIYGDHEYYWIDESCSNVLTTYYLGTDGKEQIISSYGVIIDPMSNTKYGSELNSNSQCLHIWHPNTATIDKTQTTYGSTNYSIICHQINVKSVLKANQPDNY